MVTIIRTTVVASSSFSWISTSVSRYIDPLSGASDSEYQFQHLIRVAKSSTFQRLRLLISLLVLQFQANSSQAAQCRLRVGCLIIYCNQLSLSDTPCRMQVPAELFILSCEALLWYGSTVKYSQGRCFLPCYTLWSWFVHREKCHRLL